ncbi:MAG: replicative DNA helicase [Actinobacteria bacterium]|nr:replicative DNA helicase [Actinomycetota bacterium]MCL6104262.1 replicative DNA helicase [Actinomycetota bacterium]
MVQSLEEYRQYHGRTGNKVVASNRVPPHNLEAEETLLGAMLLSKDAICEAVGICHAEDFYKPAHGYIFEMISALWSRSEIPDAVSVAEELKRAGLLEACGGSGALLSLAANTPSISNTAYYAKIIKERSLLRKLISTASLIADMGYQIPDEVGVVLDRAESMIFEIATSTSVESISTIGELLEHTMNHLERLYEKGETITGVATGYIDLDTKLAGLQPSNLIIVGARPSMGKTSFALGLVSHAAVVEKTPVLLFSLEMSHLEITQRLLCTQAEVNVSHIRNGKLQEEDWLKISKGMGPLGDAPIFIDDDPSLTLIDIRARARRLKSRENIGLVVIDYLQLMSGRETSENRQIEISEISRGLKIMARELDIPVVALSQLSRNLELRSDHHPVLADLRESGALEQDADVVLFIYRDEIYNPDSPDKGKAEIMIAKHRNGPTGMVYLTFMEQYTKFLNMAWDRD